MNWTADISLWWLLPWLIISLGLAIYFYSPVHWVKELSKNRRYLLLSVRAFTLFTIGLLLWGILFERKTFREEKPVLITLIDDSSSMLNYKDSTDVAERVQNFQNDSKEKLGEKFDYLTLNLSKTEFKKGMQFTGEQTDISASLNEIRNNFYNRNVGGVVLISDGNYNAGENPLYSAEAFNLTPFFTVGVGDTTPKKDQYIKGLTSNDFAFYKNQFPIEIEIEAKKLGGRQTKVEVLWNGQVVASQSLQYEKGNYAFKQVNFLLEAQKVGVQRYTVRLQATDGEYTLKNNARDFYLEVLDSRSRVMLLSNAPHPDISALKSVMDIDENLEVKSSLIANWDRSTKDLDLVVWHEPGLDMDRTIWELLKSKNIPVLFIIGPNSSTEGINKLGLGLSVPGGNQTDQVEATFNPSFVPFEISDELKQFFEFVPPLKSKFGKLVLPNGIDIFAYQRLGKIQKKEPLIFFGKNDGKKYGVIYGEGIWRWKLNNYVRTGDFDLFNEFIQKVTQYLVVKQNTSPFLVNLPRRITKADEFVVKAEFYNASMELITTPTIKMQLKGPSGLLNKYEFGQSGNAYRLNCGKLKPGSYTWTASTVHDGKKYNKGGVFIVEDLLIESLDNEANHSVLKQMASQTNGSFTTLDNYSALLDSMAVREDLVSVSYAESNFSDLIDLKWLFALVFLAIACEWFLRRWWGGY